MAAEDLDGDGRLEAVLLSSSEGVIAVSRFENGRLTFPEAILRKPEGWELATVAVLKHDGQPQLIVGLSQGSGNSAKLEYQRHRRDPDGRWARWQKTPNWNLPGLSGSAESNWCRWMSTAMVDRTCCPLPAVRRKQDSTSCCRAKQAS